MGTTGLNCCSEGAVFRAASRLYPLLNGIGRALPPPPLVLHALSERIIMVTLWVCQDPRSSWVYWDQRAGKGEREWGKRQLGVFQENYRTKLQPSTYQRTIKPRHRTWLATRRTSLVLLLNCGIETKTVKRKSIDLWTVPVFYLLITNSHPLYGPEREQYHQLPMSGIVFTIVALRDRELVGLIV